MAGSGFVVADPATSLYVTLDSGMSELSEFFTKSALLRYNRALAHSLGALAA